MKKGDNLLKKKVVRLRCLGKTYSEIQEIVGQQLPKSTLSNWCKSINHSPEYCEKIREIMIINVEKARKKALEVKKNRRREYLQSLFNRNLGLIEELKNNKETAKIALAMLYLGEGSKAGRSSVMFGNSDPVTISLFLYLLRCCYDVDESKFRCTLQCRADQDVPKLESYWSKITSIPLSKFYKARIDPRTIGKPSKNLDYKGVCRIDYFSAAISEELRQIVKVLYMGI